MKEKRVAKTKTKTKTKQRAKERETFLPKPIYPGSGVLPLIHLTTPKTTNILENSGGYPAIILDRPAFYNVLLKNIPKEKIKYNKRVLTITQDEDGATASCSDGR
jgi:2-polyprenyl-6-methoxyphenol hydroxylase-like FAD-dependent oxidoreductase